MMFVVDPAQWNAPVTPAFSTLPDVVEALKYLASVTMPGVPVFDGVPDTETELMQFLSIGFTRDEDEPAVEGEMFDEGNYTVGEQYALRCVLNVATGDSGENAVTNRRAECSALFAAFGAGLRANPTLGGTLRAGARATLGSVSWIYGPTQSSGSYCEVEFDVNVTASYLGTV